LAASQTVCGDTTPGMETGWNGVRRVADRLQVGTAMPHLGEGWTHFREVRRHRTSSHRRLPTSAGASGGCPSVPASASPGNHTGWSSRPGFRTPYFPPRGPRRLGKRWSAQRYAGSHSHELLEPASTIRRASCPKPTDFATATAPRRQGGSDIKNPHELLRDLNVEPATASLPSMRGRFTLPRTTLRVHTSAQVSGTVESGDMRRREVARSAVSGKSLARAVGGLLC
jgi:hypothetical protein